MNINLDLNKSIYYGGLLVVLLGIESEGDQIMAQIWYGSKDAYGFDIVNLSDLSNNRPTCEITMARKMLNDIFSEALSKLDALKIR